MTQPPLAAALADLAAPLAASLGLELWGIELAFGGRGLVRVFVENENGVSVDQCAELSRLLALSLDVEDIIPGAYVLEVSSPGLERAFFTESQLARAVGQRVEIILHEPRPAWPGRRKFRGLLQKAPETALADRRGREAEGAPENAPASDAPNAPEAGAENRDDLFLLQAEDMARPGEAAPVVAFAFAEVKKAAQIHLFPEQTPPHKGSGKKISGKKAAAGASEKAGAEALPAQGIFDPQEPGTAANKGATAAKASRSPARRKAGPAPDTEFTE